MQVSLMLKILSPVLERLSVGVEFSVPSVCYRSLPGYQ